MTTDDDSRRGRLGPAMPGYSALAEAFGAAIDGASRMTRTRAKQLAERLLTQAGLDVDLDEAATEATARINQLAEEIIAARKANQALLQRTITTELERSLGRLGLARADEVAALRAEVAALRNDVARLAADAPAAPDAAKRTAKRTGVKKAAATKTAAKKSAATRTAAKKTPAKKATAKRAVKKSAAKKTTGSSS